MPVQINEVIIRAVVDAAPSSANTEAAQPASAQQGTEYDLIEKVLEIIREKQER